MLYLGFVLILFLTILLYFRIAERFNITDVPNHRSSHNVLTIRGGGIIFPIAILLIVLFDGLSYPYFTLGLLLICTISFYDDLHPLSSVFRLLCHLLAVSLLFLNTSLFSHPVLIILLSYIFVIGSINAYNFMDGINGIIVSYSLVTILTLYFINQYVIEFVLVDWLVVCGISLIVFGIFNFRTKAKCFAGDVGSIGIAFILIFFILTLILKTGEIKFVALFLVFGLDTVTTIIFRIIRKENILIAHRSHFYQFLVNSRQWPHTVVSLIYGLLQVIINITILQFTFNLTAFFVLLVISGIAVIGLRLWAEGKSMIISSKI